MTQALPKDVVHTGDTVLLKVKIAHDRVAHVCCDGITAVDLKASVSTASLRINVRERVLPVVCGLLWSCVVGCCACVSTLFLGKGASQRCFWGREDVPTNSPPTSCLFSNECGA